MSDGFRASDRLGYGPEEIEAAAEVVRGETGLFPAVALILGSGLGGFADELAEAVPIEYSRLPGFPRSTVQGHAGRLVLGQSPFLFKLPFSFCKAVLMLLDTAQFSLLRNGIDDIGMCIRLVGIDKLSVLPPCARILSKAMMELKGLVRQVGTMSYVLAREAR